MTDARRRFVPAGQDGVTLVELLVVLVVVAIGVLALSGVQTRSSSDVYSTGRQVRALQVAQTRMEIARTAGFALAAADSGTTDGFNWSTRVDSAGVGLRHVRVDVRWSDHGRPRSLGLDNLLAQR